MPSQPEIALSLVQLVGLSLPAVAILLQVVGAAGTALNQEFDSESGSFLVIRWSLVPLVASGGLLLVYILTYSLWGIIEIFHVALFVTAIVLLLSFIFLVTIGVWFMSGLGLGHSYQYAITEFRRLLEQNRSS